MIIKKLQLEGFRNYKNLTITFEDKNLIMGANDVGKTNLLYALRLLFDKSLSERDLELHDSDFYVYDTTSTVRITAFLEKVTEDCLVSAFGGDLKDEKVIIRYINEKESGYRFFIGPTEILLDEKPGRTYIKYLNMQYVDTNRDLQAFFKRERNQILNVSKTLLGEEDSKFDEEKYLEIQNGLNDVNSKVNELKYVEKALESVNNELESMNSRNEGMKIRFVAGQSDAGKMLDNLSLAYLDEDNLLAVGGDGRNNQVFISTWVAKQNIQKAADHVTFYAIEEPEAHLHPHQQRKLSEYILNQFDEQVFITSHSPQITTRFNPSKIIRLYVDGKTTNAACGGTSEIIKETFADFGHRLNIISAESFFADAIFLVEGTSETILYSALAKANNIDLDRDNISVLSVEGVGFKPYIAVCKAFEIPFVLRTDNDIFKKNNNQTEFYAGISRAVSIAQMLDGSEDVIKYWDDNNSKNEWNAGGLSQDNSDFNNEMREKLKTLGIYLSDVDLETDLANSPIQDDLMEFYQVDDNDTLIKEMKKRKAENILAFVQSENANLQALKDDNILKPLNDLTRKITRNENL